MDERPQLFGLLKRDETVFHREQPAPQAALAPHEERVMSALFASGDDVDAADLRNNRITSYNVCYTKLLRFCTLWRFYLQYCEGGFRGGGITVSQVTLVKRA